jgi:adenylate cyclase
MRIGTERRLRLLGRVVTAGTVLGSAYGALLNVAAFGTPRFGIPIGGLHGLLLSGSIGMLEIFGTRTRPGRAVEQAPFLVTLLVKALLWGSLIAFVNIVEPGTRLMGVPLGAPRLQLVSVVFSFAVTAAVIFILQIARIVGGRTLRDWVLGRYHRPRAEDRFFLFVDIAGSTALAERIGPVAVHQFLNRVFVLASDPVDDYRGEIYQYVGDEMVITWRTAEAGPGARPLGCFAGIEAALEAATPEFLRDFGTAPRVRGALHAGPVVVGEVGGRKRDIVFHGDVMNTTARLEQVARDLDRRLVISEDALRCLPGAAGHPVEDLGVRQLRGRRAPVRIYAIATPGRVAQRLAAPST